MNNRITLFALLLHFMPVVTFGVNSSEDSEPYEQKLEQGIEAFYQTDWDKAGKIFEELQSYDGKDPRAFFFDAMIPFWKYFFAGNSPEAASDFLSRSELAIEISQNRLDRNPHDTTMVLMLSGLHGYRSLVAASEKNYQTAIQSGMTGYTYTRQLLALDNADPRALIGKGIFYYMIGTVPNELRWATNMMGIRGDMEEGFAILEKAATSDSYISNDAKMILSYLYKREEKFKKAIRHIKDLCERYDNNIIFRFNYAELLEKTNQEHEAKKIYKSLIQSQNSHLSELKAQSRKKIRRL